MMFLVKVLLLCLVRTIRAVKLFRSRDWPVAEATVTSVTTETQNVHVHYQYLASGLSHNDTDTRLFLWPGPAKVYADSFRPGALLKIRVKPDDPSVSVLERP